MQTVLFVRGMIMIKRTAPAEAAGAVLKRRSCSTKFEFRFDKASIFHKKHQKNRFCICQPRQLTSLVKSVKVSSKKNRCMFLQQKGAHHDYEACNPYEHSARDGFLLFLLYHGSLFCGPVWRSQKSILSDTLLTRPLLSTKGGSVSDRATFYFL